MLPLLHTHPSLLHRSGLVMLQTTNSIFDQSLYQKLTYEGLLAWHRVRIANWIAAGGRQWSEVLTQYNTGWLGGWVGGWVGGCCSLCCK